MWNSKTSTDTSSSFYRDRHGYLTFKEEEVHTPKEKKLEKKNKKTYLFDPKELVLDDEE